MANNHSEIEKRLWASADELRANSKLKSSEYSVPVLGLIFLRYADHRFAAVEKELAGKGTGRRAIGKLDYQAKGVMYLPPQARFSQLLALPEGENIGKAINEAMKAVEDENEELKGILPKSYNKIENATLVSLFMAQAIYREWFVNFRFPGHEKVKLINSPLGKIPEGWKPLRLGDMAKEVRRGVDPSQVDPDTPYIGLEHLPRRSITLGEWGKAADVQSMKLAFKKREILFGKIRPYFHKVGVAPVDGVCSSDAIVIVPTSASAFGPVVCCVSSDDFVRHATQTSQGTKMPRANWDVLVKYSLPIPPDGLLNNFNEIIADVVATLRLLMMKSRKLRTTRDLLLPKLISGQLDVEELDIDAGEPLMETEV